MVFWRFDQKTTLLTIVRELHARGVSLDDMDVRLCEIGPVDLDLLRECFDEVAKEFAGRDTVAA